MDLKEFVKESLVQISKGIEEANDALSETDAMINPLFLAGNSGNAQIYARTQERNVKVSNPDSRVVEKFDFDIAVVVDKGAEGTAGAKLSIASIGIGAEGKTESRSRSESRIKFSVPVVLPGYENET